MGNFKALPFCLIALLLICSTARGDIIVNRGDGYTSDAITRAFAVGTGDLYTTPTYSDAIAREFAVGTGVLYTSPTFTDAISREFAVGTGFLYTSPEITDVVAREFSVGLGERYRVEIVDAISREFSVLIPQPDLRPTDVATSPTILAGEPFVVTWTVENEGLESPDVTWSDTVWFSSNNTIGANDRLLGTLPRTPPLEPGQSYQRSISPTIPIAGEYPAGDYWIIVETDAGNAVQEGDEQDNILAGFQVTLQRPALGDLVVASVDTPDDAKPGDVVSVNWMTTNGGSLPISGGWTEEIAAIIPGDPDFDFVLKVVSLNTTLNPTESIMRQTLVALPDLPSDDYQIRVTTNSRNDVLEETTANNSTASSAAVFSRPDLVASAVSAPLNVTGDQLASVNWLVTNDGAAPTAGIWTDSVFIAPAAGGTGRLLGSFDQSGALQPASSYMGSLDVTIPGDLPDGDYLFRVSTNYSNDFTETGPPSNNDAVSTQTTTLAQPPRPNLIVSSITVPPGGLAGEAAVVEWDVQNDGSGSTSGSWVDRVTAVAMSGDEFLLAEVPASNVLANGESYQRQANVNYPFLFDTYQIRVETDADNELNEGLAGGEDDNVELSTGTFMVDSYTVTAQADIEEEPAPVLVTISGVASKISDSSPAPNVPVNVEVAVQGTTRVYSATTNGSGEYSLFFSPLMNEGGNFSLTAGPPGFIDPTVQDTFIIHGLRPAKSTPATILVEDNGLPTEFIITFRNNGDVQQTGLAASLDLPARLSGSVDLSSMTIPPLGSVQASVTLNVVNGRSVASREDAFFDVILTSAEGAEARADIRGDIRPPAAHIVSSKSSLSATIVRSTEMNPVQEFVTFRLTNEGSDNSGAVTVNIPGGQDLFTVTTPNPIPNLAPNEWADVTLRISAAPEWPLGPVSGTIFISSDNGNNFNLPYNFRVLSDSFGSLEVSVTDEFTYWDADNGYPGVEGATVKVLDAYTKVVVDEDLTTSSGMVLFTGLREGYYIVDASAPRHQASRQTVYVEGEETLEIEAFLPRSVVTYEWSVTPVSYEDRYRIDIEAVFETFVPAPVITIEPNNIRLEDYEGKSSQINFTITNHGLIRADDLSLNISNTDRWKLTPLVEEIGDLEAMTSVVVPVKIEDLGVARSANRIVGCKVPGATVRWELLCGIPRPYFTSVSVTGTGGDGCGGGAVFPQGGGSGGGTINVSGSPSVIQPSSCNPCLNGFIECGIGCIPGPIGCGAGIAFAGRDCAFASTFRERVRCIAGAISAALGCSPYGPYGCALCLVLALENCAFEGGLYGRAAAGVTASAAQRYMILHALRMRGYFSIFNLIYDRTTEEPWYEGLNPNNSDDILDWMIALADAMDEASEGEFMITNNELATLLAMEVPGNLETEDVLTIVERWNRTSDYYDQGIFEIADVPMGDSTDFIPWSVWNDVHQASLDAMEENFDDGFVGTYDGIQYALAELEVAADAEPAGVCARVVIQISQEAVLSRSAFEAKLILTNEGDLPLENLQVDVFVDDENGGDATNLFGIVDPTLTGIGALDGTESLSSGGEVLATWTLIPSDEAAPVGETFYEIRGHMSYVLDGTEVDIPLFPVAVTVLPNPQLELDYFLARDVYSDDPFTMEIEPVEPFDLGLLVRNTGVGLADNLEIISSQPKIIENERGLLIDFNIIGTQVGTEPVNPTLTAQIGDLAAGELESVRWLMTSSLQGQFISYEASFQHLSSLDDERFSIIKRVDIHPLTKAVFATHPSDDLRFDFLSDDQPDLMDLPETLFQSTGEISPVESIIDAQVLETPTPGNNFAVIAVQVTTPGFIYLRIDDPTGGDLYLAGVAREDKPLGFRQENAWQTIRTIRPEGDPPYTEARVHIFDHVESGDLSGKGNVNYRLVYSEFEPPEGLFESWMLF